MRFTKDHEWLEIADGVATVGVSAYAADQLGDVVFVDLPEVGKAVKAGDSLAVVESVKAASDIYAPAAGVVVEVNEALGAAPETVNESPEGRGWFARLRLEDPAAGGELMDRSAYERFLKSL